MPTLSEVLALFPDNTQGDISAADVRDGITALWERTDGTAAVENTLYALTHDDIHTPGLVHWNDDIDTLEVDLPLSGVRLQVGHETLLTVRNNSGATIPNGRPVRIVGALGNRPTIALDQGLGRIAGVATHDIANNADGKITTFGLVNELDLSAFADGVFVYASATGTLQTATTASFVGVVTRSHATMGTLFTRPTSLAQTSGTTAQRPTVAPTGFMYFDTTLNRPIWRSGAGWVDAAGVAA
jgi:hypothetical protein